MSKLNIWFNIFIKKYIGGMLMVFFDDKKRIILEYKRVLLSEMAGVMKYFLKVVLVIVNILDGSFIP